MAEARTNVSVVIPVYNEALAIREVLRRVCSAPLPDDFEIEVVVVDDGSTDATLDAVQGFVEEHPQYASCIQHHGSLINHGKGAALRAGFVIARGDILLVQDGDLEYSPLDYPALLEPFRDPDVHIVYGSRFSTGTPSGMRLPNRLANRILSWTTTLLYRQRITDEATGYKVFRRPVLDHFDLACRRFEFCPEFTGKALKAGFRIHEVPVRYDPRGILDGKKIKASDGFLAMWWLVKVWLRGGSPRPVASTPGKAVGEPR